MPRNITEIVNIKNDQWTEIAGSGISVLITPPDKPKPFIIFYTFAETLPSSDLLYPSHKYVHEEYGESVQLGSSETEKVFVRLSPSYSEEDMDISITKTVEDPITTNKTAIELWTDLGFCFQYNRVVTFPAGNKYYLFDPSAISDDIVLHILPLLFINCEDGPITVNYRILSDYTGGTPLPIINRNGNSSLTFDSVVTEDPTGSDLGTISSQNKVATGGTLPANLGGGSSKDASPFIASKNIIFLIEVVNGAGVPVTAEIFFEFCEVPSRYN